MLTSAASSPLLSFLLLLLLVASSGPALATLRNTSSGKIRGEVRRVDGTSTDVEHFLGIPYAEPPVGKLRYARPVSVRPWTDVKDTKKSSPACWQYLPTRLDRENSAAAVWLNNTHMSEDCLYLNVWVPRDSSRTSRRRAMLVWIYGGGFVGGSANLEIYNGAYLAATSDIVVASMQYRVGPFGFLYLHTDPQTGGKSPDIANAGLWDQNMAIAWLHRNAHAFGVDPNRITLMGESAGAVSVSMHLLSPHSERLFARAILQSGSFLAPWSLQSPQLAHRRALQFAYTAGCLRESQLKSAIRSSEADNNRLLECLRGIDPQTVVNSMGSVTSGEEKARRAVLNARFPSRVPNKSFQAFDLLRIISFTPVQEPVFFPLTPDEATARRTLKQAPLLLGANGNEGSYFLFYYLPPLFEMVINGSMKTFANVTEKSLQLVPEDYLTDYILPVNYLYPEVLDQIMLMYSVPSNRLSPYELRKMNKTHWIKVLDEITGDMNFKCSVTRLGETYAMMNQKVFLYNFEHRTKSNSFPAWTGTMHGYELEYTFGMPLSKKFQRSYYTFTDAERRLSRDIMTRWSNFVKTGNPNLNEGQSRSTLRPQWPVYRMEDKLLLRFLASDSREKVEVGNNSRWRFCQLWGKLVPKLSQRLSKMACSAQLNSAWESGPRPFLLSLAVLGVWMKISFNWRTELNPSL